MDAVSVYATDYEAREDMADRAYRAYAKDKTCGDCGACEKPESDGYENPTRIGWCTWYSVFVGLDDSVLEDRECETCV